MEDAGDHGREPEGDLEDALQGAEGLLKAYSEEIERRVRESVSTSCTEHSGRLEQVTRMIHSLRDSFDSLERHSRALTRRLRYAFLALALSGLAVLLSVVAVVLVLAR